MESKDDKAVSALKKYFKQHKYAQLDDLVKVLGTTSRMTIFRKLSKLNYISSFTHAGKYYSAPSYINFDKDGLWIKDKIGFSQFGNLIKTIT